MIGRARQWSEFDYQIYRASWDESLHAHCGRQGSYRYAHHVCTRSDALAASSSYPAITLTVNVANNAASSLTNGVTVSGSGESNISNDSASDVTSITQLPDLTVAKQRLNTAFDKMRELGLRDPVIEERDSDVMVTILHEPLASPEEPVLQYVEKGQAIRNNKAQEISLIQDADQMKRILQKMVKKNLIEGVPNTRGGGFTYRKKK